MLSISPIGTVDGEVVAGRVRRAGGVDRDLGAEDLVAERRPAGLLAIDADDGRDPARPARSAVGVIGKDQSASTVSYGALTVANVAPSGPLRAAWTVAVVGAPDTPKTAKPQSSGV